MAQPEFRTFEEFWPFYVREHAQKANRTLHFVGTTLAMASVAAGLLSKRRALLLAAPVLGYGGAWIGHFFIEKNRPATFKYPLWSFRGDMVMWWKTLTGTMDAEVAQASTSNGIHHDEPAPAPDSAPHAGPQTAN